MQAYTSTKNIGTSKFNEFSPQFDLKQRIYILTDDRLITNMDRCNIYNDLKIKYRDYEIESSEEPYENKGNLRLEVGTSLIKRDLSYLTDKDKSTVILDIKYIRGMTIDKGTRIITFYDNLKFASVNLIKKSKLNAKSEIYMFYIRVNLDGTFILEKYCEKERLY